MVIGGGDGAGREQGGKAAVAGCFGVSLGCIGGGFLCLIFEVYITIFWLCKGGKVWVVWMCCFVGGVQASGEVSEGGACTAVFKGECVGGVWGVGGLWVLLRWLCLRRYCRCVGRCLRDVVVFIGIGGRDGGALECQC